jgi:single-stranded-DNA-specific exonuclease
MRGGNLPSKPKWVLHPPAAPGVADVLCAELQLHPVVAQILARRGLETAEAARRFMQPSLEHPHDPFLLKGMEAAAARIAEALAGGERIVISGDYDVDGMTSSAVLGHFLRAAGCESATTFIPNRFEHGYGLTAASVDALLALRPQLVITVDNGITAVAEIERLHAAGVDTIVTDHHLPRPEGVPGGIVVNPRQPDCAYPFKGISGCGVTFKLLTALRRTLRERNWWSAARPEPNLKEYLDLVAIGTVADVVPLVDENRVFVRAGLEVLNGPRLRPGVAALIEAARVRNGITSRTIAFQLAPRLNAAGRMAEGAIGVELLLADSPAPAAALARRLEEENRKRRGKGDEMLREALALIAAEGLEAQPGMVVASQAFHEGIIGIIAARLVERYQRPVVVLAENGDGCKGSARSVPGINVTEAITECAHLLQEFGGHSGAAGCRLPKEHVPAFREAFGGACARLAMAAPEPTQFLDGTLAPDQLSHALVEQLELLQPFGHGNEQPTFLLEGTHLSGPAAVLAERHLKWNVAPGVEMVAWNLAGNHEPAPDHTYRVSLGFNDYRGTRKIQLTVEDVR